MSFRVSSAMKTKKSGETNQVDVLYFKGAEFSWEITVTWLVFPLNRKDKEKGMRFGFQQPLVEEALRDTPDKGRE